ncbi:DEAD/DEAH box helicase [Heliophilum fasciatum]|uniref:Superfamily II DNA/RNA helicase n=1 Tax=Heliophilum fasciatum TaxID=35700 RepID=A0A4R2RW29_9FIRM|nr:DEAD/DEAH box helicase [Heliophilum fasciatum]MCW2276900.1 superfamily II DNA/RNA helicase [Heliophilum fasciatum]TCP68640.1 superfamily II DNA/RNA helicase [Heliophilum fasciatum]
MTDPWQTFEGLPPFILTVCQANGFQKPTPIQQKAVPLILAGKDVLAESPTGTGKTLAYVWPILSRMNPDIHHAQAVILAPTRELAVQIHQEVQKFTQGTSIGAVALIGGADVRRQVEKLKSHPQVIVGTPARVADLIQARKLKMHEVRTIVIDEADMMLEMGFMGVVREIIRTTVRDRQLLFFSATVPAKVETVAQGLLRSPEVIRVSAQELDAIAVAHRYYVCRRPDKAELLRRIIKSGPIKALVFVNDGAFLPHVASRLLEKKVDVEVLQGEAPAAERSQVMQKFRHGQSPVLIATDLAARGLDVAGVTHVIQYDLPEKLVAYVHRAGRTGRMGAAGQVISLVTPEEEKRLLAFCAELGIEAERATFSLGTNERGVGAKKPTKRLKEPGMRSGDHRQSAKPQFAKLQSAKPQARTEEAGEFEAASIGRAPDAGEAPYRGKAQKSGGQKVLKAQSTGHRSKAGSGKPGTNKPVRRGTNRNK